MWHEALEENYFQQIHVIPNEYHGGKKGWGVFKNEMPTSSTKGNFSFNNMPSRYSRNFLLMFYEWEGNGAYLVIGVRSFCTMRTLLYVNHEAVRAKGTYITI